jgi:hypothetical protein
MSLFCTAGRDYQSWGEITIIGYYYNGDDPIRSTHPFLDEAQ